MFESVCNTTLEDQRIGPTSEVTILGSLTFHDVALIVSGACTVFSVFVSLTLIWLHAFNYTKPREQKHIIRILFMVPVYSVASWLSLRYYWHAIYFQVISDCYEAFAISSFFALLCHYLGPDLHEQKEFFRYMRPIKGWVLPLSWFRACCGSERKGPWRTPGSGLTWFNIIWLGIYQYCFVRVAMTITAVVTQYFGRYCETSNSPFFSHIWVTVVNAVAVSVAMYLIIQFYVQLRVPLAEHQPFLKVLAIKLVIFLSFWQAAAISVGTSTLQVVKPNSVLAYPDIKVGLPAILLCFEMALFSILHIWAFPYAPYLPGARQTFYPSPDPSSDNGGKPPRENEHGPRSGGFLGLRALWDAINIWDVVKAVGRGVRWLFVGYRHRHDDISYQQGGKNGGVDMDDLTPQRAEFDGVDTAYPAGNGGNGLFGHRGKRSTDHLPIANQFRRSKFDMLYGRSIGAKTPDGGAVLGAAGAGVRSGSSAAARSGSSAGERPGQKDEKAGLIANAQPEPSSPPMAVAADRDARFAQQQRQLRQIREQDLQEQQLVHPYYRDNRQFDDDIEDSAGGLPTAVTTDAREYRGPAGPQWRRQQQPQQGPQHPRKQQPSTDPTVR